MPTRVDTVTWIEPLRRSDSEFDADSKKVNRKTRQEDVSALTYGDYSLPSSPDSVLGDDASSSDSSLSADIETIILDSVDEDFSSAAEPAASYSAAQYEPFADSSEEVSDIAFSGDDSSAVDAVAIDDSYSIADAYVAEDVDVGELEGSGVEYTADLAPQGILEPEPIALASSEEILAPVAEPPARIAKEEAVVEEPVLEAVTELEDPLAVAAETYEAYADESVDTGDAASYSDYLQKTIDEIDAGPLAPAEITPTTGDLGWVPVETGFGGQEIIDPSEDVGVTNQI